MKRIVFSRQAREDVGRLDRDTAMRIFTALHRFAQTGVGDIKRLQGETIELRLREVTIASASLRSRIPSTSSGSFVARKPTAENPLAISWLGLPISSAARTNHKRPRQFGRGWPRPAAP